MRGLFTVTLPVNDRIEIQTKSILKSHDSSTEDRGRVVTAQVPAGSCGALLNLQRLLECSDDTQHFWMISVC